MASNKSANCDLLVLVMNAKERSSLNLERVFVSAE